MLWFLAREVLRIRGTLPRNEPWDVMPDLFFYRDQEEAVKEEPAAVADTHDYNEPIPGQPEQEWGTEGTTIGQNVQLQPGYATTEEWSATEENWNKGAPGAESWTNQQGSTWANN